MRQTGPPSVQYSWECCHCHHCCSFRCKTVLLYSWHSRFFTLPYSGMGCMVCVRRKQILKANRRGGSSRSLQWAADIVNFRSSSQSSEPLLNGNLWDGDHGPHFWAPSPTEPLSFPHTHLSTQSPCHILSSRPSPHRAPATLCPPFPLLSPLTHTTFCSSTPTVRRAPATLWPPCTLQQSSWHFLFFHPLPPTKPLMC